MSRFIIKFWGDLWDQQGSVVHGIRGGSKNRGSGFETRWLLVNLPLSFNLERKIRLKLEKIENGIYRLRKCPSVTPEFFFTFLI